jgi:hypothetical protein
VKHTQKLQKTAKESLLEHIILNMSNDVNHSIALLAFVLGTTQNRRELKQELCIKY